MLVFRTYRFHSARFLPNLDADHICKKIHGHTFNLTIYISGTVNVKNGFIVDFFDIDKIFNKNIMPKIDHKLLNEIEGLDNPTSEILCKWIWNKLVIHLPNLFKLKLSEDHGTGIIYKGE